MLLMPNKKGFTLIEVLISSLIIAIIMLTIYSAFQGGVFGYRNIEDNISVYQSSRIALERISQDLRNSFCYSQSLSKFEGSADKVSFMALVDSYKNSKIDTEYALVSYFNQDDKLMRLCRKLQESLKAESEVQADEINSGLEIKFEYGHVDTDATTGEQIITFEDTWGTASQEQAKALPVAVKLTLTTKGSKISRVFTRTVYLPLANNA